MQVYRGMDIGTAKPSRAERDEVPHHLIDVAEPGERFTVARFAGLVADALAGIEAHAVGGPCWWGGPGSTCRRRWGICTRQANGRPCAPSWRPG